MTEGKVSVQMTEEKMDHLMTAEGEDGPRNPMIEAKHGYLEMKDEREGGLLKIEV